MEYIKTFLKWFSIGILLTCLYLGGLRIVDPAKFYTKIGLKCWKYGFIMWSITNYNKAIEHNPKYAKAYRSRGVAFYELDKNKLAINDYNRAIELDPKSENALVLKNRGLAYMWLGEEKLARQDFDKACKMGKCIDFKSMCEQLKTACDAGKCEGFEFSKKEGYCVE